MSFSSSGTSDRGISLRSPTRAALGWYAALVRAFTDEQAFWIVSDAAHGASVASLMKKHGFTRAQFAKWKKKWPIRVMPEPTCAQLNALWAWRPNWSRARIWETYRRAAEMIEEGWSLPAFDGPNVHVKAVTEARSLVVCDKHVVACWLNQRNVEERSIAEVTRSSISCVGGALLTREKVEAITSYARHAKVPIAFLGDLDPSALHVFATLRAGGREEFLRSSRPRVDATWIGTDSKWIAWLERRSIDIRSIAVEMHEAQRAHWKVMQALMPDARALIGRRASKLLDEGWQLDIDMIMAHTREPFMHALVRRLQRSQAA